MVTEGEMRTYEGLACHVSIDVTACPAFPRAKVTMKGLDIDTMASLTRLGYEAWTREKNRILIEADNGAGGYSKVFSGDILTAWANFNAAPNVEFQIDALSGIFPTLTPQSPMSIKGQQSAANTIETLCKQMGYKFENNGVTDSVSNCTIEGDPMTKIKKIAEMIKVNVIIDNDTVAILPNGKVRETGSVPSISAENGLIGYPTFSEKGVNFECLYRPEIRIGGKVVLSSIVPRSSGEWIVIGLKHELAAFDPSNSVWKSSVQAIFPRFGK